jgi:hypothetical protein
LDIRDSRKPDELIIEDCRFGAGNSWYNVSITGIVAKTHSLRYRVEISNTSPHALKLRAAACFVQLGGNQHLIAVMSGLDEYQPIIASGQRELFERDFLVSEAGALRFDDASDQVHVKLITVMSLNGTRIPLECVMQIPLGVLHYILSDSTRQAT